MRGNGFKLEEDRFRFDIKKKSFTMKGVEALEQDVQRCDWRSDPGDFQDKVGSASGQPDLSVHCRRVILENL